LRDLFIILKQDLLANNYQIFIIFITALIHPQIPSLTSRAFLKERDLFGDQNLAGERPGS
ncbi:MAG: hypothetical protein ACLFP9_07985, partial [Desulfonatronovibrio sp.]